MKPRETTTSLRAAAAMGFLAGLRSLSPLALAARAANQGRLRPVSALSLAGKTPLTSLLAVAAAGELVYDKMPQAISRISLMGQAGRLVNGGITGALVADGCGASIRGGAILGATGSIAGSRVGHFARTRLAKRLPVPPLVVGLLEDAVAIGGSLLVLQSVTPSPVGPPPASVADSTS